MFDYASTFARKNPLAVIRAFRRAFDQSSGAQLVVHSINGGGELRKRRELEREVGGREDIHLIDGYLSHEQKDALLARCDCYVSLHRAEGFGVPLAEAMRLAKPVIATGWSGNLEFMNRDNSYLVDYTLVPVGRTARPYLPVARWAEPDIEHAARLMRDVFVNQQAAAARGRVGAREVMAAHDPSEVGKRLVRELRALEADSGRGGAAARGQ
jgi:glycosyltransferase involved in cell wall biosynthesis